MYITGVDEKLLEELKKEFLDRYNIGKVLTKNRLKADLIVEDLLKF